jgi:hypothetical protein
MSSGSGTLVPAPHERHTKVHRRTDVSRAAARTRSPSARDSTLPPPRPRREARNELKPPAAVRIPASTAQPRHLRAAAIGDLHADKTVPRADRDRDRPARDPRPAVLDTIAEQLAHQQGGVIPAQVPGTEHPRPRTRGRPAPAPPARPPSRSPGSPAQPSAHPPSPAAPPPAHHRGRQAGYTGMHARLSGSRQAGTRDRRGPSVAVRGKPTVHTDRSGGPDARPLYVRGHRDTAVHSATR